MEIEQRVDNFNELLKKRINGNILGYGVLFKTNKRNFFYDTGTSKVLDCSNYTYDVLINIFKNNGKLCLNQNEKDINLLMIALDEIEQAIKEENILSKPQLVNFDEGYILKCCEAPCCSQLILEVTQRCNFRCNYCIYCNENQRFRNFSNQDMTFEIAKKAMDYALKIGNKKTMAFTFYGGEPLLRFDLIKDCIEYFEKNYDGEKLTFNLTSNLSVLTDDMATFFYNKKVYITCSLDGYEEIHNKNRKYANGKGTFKNTIAGLKKLVLAYGKKASELININMVFDKPYNIDKLEKLQEYITTDYLLKEIDVSISYADYPTEYKPSRINVMQIGKENKYSDVIGDWTFDKVLHSEQKIFSDNYILDRLEKIHNRRIEDSPFIHKGLNGCCIPGERRIYVDATGKYMVCEKIGNAPCIGNVKDGLSLDQIRKFYVEEYCKKSLHECSECWAINLCGVCYATLFNENGLQMSQKMKRCNAQKYAWYKSLIRYHTLLYEKPEILDKFNNKEIGE